MIRRYSLIRLLVLVGLLVAATQLALAQSRAIRPVTIQIPDGEQVELYKGSYALVIGASDYQDNSWGDLSSVREDVKAVREALEEQGFQVDTLLDPTEDTLIDEINDFIDAHGYDRENRLLFYYAGHGYTQERNGRKFGYLVPVDAPNPYDNERAFFRKSLKMEQVLSWAKQIESKHALFVFDSCFSGSVLQSRAVAVPEDISYLTAKPVRQFISAGSANQTVPAISVFRPLFIRGINGQADLDKDGYVTGVELGMYLQKQVPRYQTGQTPQYGKILDPYLDEGNFVFEAESQQPKQKPQSIPPAVKSVELDDLQKQVEATEQARLEQQRLDQIRLEQQRLDQIRLEQQRVQTQWQRWQIQMQQDYQKISSFEKKSIDKEMKIESLQRFLSVWKDENPYSTQDDELREEVQTRIIYLQMDLQTVRQNQTETNNVLSGESAREILLNGNQCVGCDLRGANLEGANLEGANLEGAFIGQSNLNGANLNQINMNGTNLSKASLNRTYLSKAQLDKADLSKAQLDKADLSEASLHRAYLSEAYLSEANLYNSDLSEASLHRAYLSEANLNSANLYNADLYGANLRGTNLRGADLRGADLRGADLRGADLSKAKLNNTKLYSEKLNKYAPSELDLLEALVDSAKFCNTIMPDGSINNDDC
jgi:uncharacterized protein YjbI with pentapeptide repeats